MAAQDALGFLYLFTTVTANFAEFYARGRLIVSGDAVQTANNIATAFSTRHCMCL